jgi:O-acetyl-ADP-ribose deacetylase (regulator of RNase III)
MRRDVNGHTLRLVQGDITTATTDAIVNAANQYLAGGGGVDGAIHRAGGDAIAEDCARIGGCPTGDAVSTRAGKLNARHVIHAVAPRWRGGGSGELELLASAYRRSLDLAGAQGDRSVSLPSLGTGIYGNPIDQAAPIALRAAIEHLQGQTNIDEIVFYLYSEADLRVYTAVLGDLLPE